MKFFKHIIRVTMSCPILGPTRPCYQNQTRYYKEKKKIQTKSDPAIHKKVNPLWQVEFVPGTQGWYNNSRPTDGIHRLHKLKMKSQVHLKIQKSIWRNSTSIHDKSAQQTRNRKKFPQLDKGLPWKPHSKHYTQWWKTKCFYSKTRNKAHISLPAWEKTFTKYVSDKGLVFLKLNNNEKNTPIKKQDKN